MRYWRRQVRFAEAVGFDGYGLADREAVGVDDADPI